MAISKHYPEGFQWQNQLPGGKTRILPDPVDDQVMEFMKDYLQMKKEMKESTDKHINTFGRGSED